MTHAVLAFTLASTGTFQRLIVIANVAVLLMYGVVCAGVLQLRAKNVRAGGDPFVLPGGRVIPLMAVGVLAVLLSGATAVEWEATGITLVLATALYRLSLIMRQKSATAG